MVLEKYTGLESRYKVVDLTLKWDEVLWSLLLENELGEFLLFSLHTVHNLIYMRMFMGNCKIYDNVSLFINEVQNDDSLFMS